MTTGTMSPKTPRYGAARFLHSARKMPGVEWNPRAPPRRPIDHSAQARGSPSSSNATKYGIMNVPPSYFAAKPGKRRKLPSPTALPVTARITPILPDQFSCGALLIREGRYLALPWEATAAMAAAIAS